MRFGYKPLGSRFRSSGNRLPWLLPTAVLGLGTGRIYPTMLAAISHLMHPSLRASALSVKGFWRDSGYARAALTDGNQVDLFRIQAAVPRIAALTVISGSIRLYQLLGSSRKTQLRSDSTVDASTS